MELPDSEEPKHGVRIGWSAESSDLQLGEHLFLHLISIFCKTLVPVNLAIFLYSYIIVCEEMYRSKVVLLYFTIGEASLSYGYESSGKICASSNFAEYADPFGEGDIIGVYLVSIALVMSSV